MKKIILNIVLSLILSSSISAQEFQHLIFTVDVALNGISLIANGEVDTDPDCPYPVAGSDYIIRQGFIYPYSILDCDNITNSIHFPCINGIDTMIYRCGIDIDTGNAEFPDTVIGDWDCRGWFTQDVASATQGIFDLSTQTFNFTDIPDIGGMGSITTDGAVLREFGEEKKRAVVGGTGIFRNVFGEVTQKVIGANFTGTINIRTTFNLYYL